LSLLCVAFIAAGCGEARRAARTEPADQQTLIVSPQPKVNGESLERTIEIIRKRAHGLERLPELERQGRANRPLQYLVPVKTSTTR
jgi:hypothetical protein